jgi:hypothetical protein
MHRLTLRDVFWLIAIIAMAIGWSVDHRNAGRRFDEAAKKFDSEKQRMESMLRVYRWHYRPSRTGLVHEGERVPPDPAIFHPPTTPHLFELTPPP